MADTTVELLKVGTSSNPNKVAGAIAMSLQKVPTVKICAVGAGAINQSVKAIIVAKGFLAPKGITMHIDFSFVTIDIEGSEKTAIEFTLTHQK